MNNIDKKKCADLLRDMCDQREKEPHYADIRTEVFNIRKIAESLWPKDKNLYALMQWDEMKKRINWQGTEEGYETALEGSLKTLKDKYQKPEIVY